MQAFSEPKPESRTAGRRPSSAQPQGLAAASQEKGIILKSFKYGGRSYQLPKTYPIVGISLSEQNFEGEELLRGIFSWKVGFKYYLLG